MVSEVTDTIRTKGYKLPLILVGAVGEDRKAEVDAYPTAAGTRLRRQSRRACSGVAYPERDKRSE
jgi:hypothetical protein